MKIEKVDLYRLRVPLQQPYKIATAVMAEFDMTLAVIQSGGREGIGEAMAAIEGYFRETAEEVWNFASEMGKEILGCDIHAAHRRVSSFRKDRPCAVTPILTALEMLTAPPLLAPPTEPMAVPMVGILQAKEPRGLQEEIHRYCSSGYRTLKIKVGFDAQSDIALVKAAQEALRGKARLRADANQGYTLEQARLFVNEVDPAELEFLEQPLPEDQWDALAELSRTSPIALGLDESIYDLASVEKARTLKAVRFIKFKLMKIGSPRTLAEHIEKSRSYGLQIIMGNGAAGDVNCFHEALIAGRMGIDAGEMNGFLKQKESILAEGLKTEGGKILLRPDYRPRLDPKKVEKYAADRLILG